jgi:hypothetical protein
MQHFEYRDVLGVEAAGAVFKMLHGPRLLQERVQHEIFFRRRDFRDCPAHAQIALALRRLDGVNVGRRLQVAAPSATAESQNRRDEQNQTRLG